MSARGFVVLLSLVCLAPLIYTGSGRAWISPWHEAELQSCVGDYVLPSGLFLPVRIDGDQLLAGVRRWKMRRVAPFFYVGESKKIRLRFRQDASGAVGETTLSGTCPPTRARRATSRDADSARMADVGGHSIRLNVAGTGHSGPTVILETGPLGGLEGVSQWQADVAEFARVVAYDHPGTGGSQPGPTPQTAATVVRQLRTALADASVEPPFIVAGMSMGGPYSRVFADLYPNETCGLVWIDPTPDWEHLYAWCSTHAPDMQREINRAMQWLDLGIETGMRNSPEMGRRDEWESMDLTWEEVRRASLPAIPIVQITGAEDYRTRAGAELKVRYFSEWLTANLPHAQHILALHSRHGVYATEPNLVLDAIRSVYEEN